MSSVIFSPDEIESRINPFDLVKKQYSDEAKSKIISVSRYLESQSASPDPDVKRTLAQAQNASKKAWHNLPKHQIFIHGPRDEGPDDKLKQAMTDMQTALNSYNGAKTKSHSSSSVRQMTNLRGLGKSQSLLESFLEEVTGLQKAKLPPHLQQYFDSKGNPKKTRNIVQHTGNILHHTTDVTPKGYGPSDKPEKTPAKKPFGKGVMDSLDNPSVSALRRAAKNEIASKDRLVLIIPLQGSGSMSPAELGRHVNNVKKLGHQVTHSSVEHSSTVRVVITKSMGKSLSKAAGWIDAARKIVSEHQHGKIQGTAVDVTTANMIVSIYDKLKDKNKSHFGSLSVSRAMSVGWKLVRKNEPDQNNSSLNKGHGPEDKPVRGIFKDKDGYTVVTGYKSGTFRSENSAKQFWTKWTSGKPIPPVQKSFNNYSDQYENIAKDVKKSRDTVRDYIVKRIVFQGRLSEGEKKKGNDIAAPLNMEGKIRPAEEAPLREKVVVPPYDQRQIDRGNSDRLAMSRKGKIRKFIGDYIFSALSKSEKEEPDAA